MEGGLHVDQNFYRRRQLPHHPADQNQNYQPLYESPSLPESHSRSSRRLPGLNTADIQAAATNGVDSGLTRGGDPAEFYRDYRGVQQSSSSYTDITTSGMSAAASESRPTQSSLRSNGNGTTPKYPSLSAARSGLKPAYRSASAPLDDKRAVGNSNPPALPQGYPATRQPSVKDLLKRFDQNNDQPSSTARKPVPWVATKDSSPPRAHGNTRDRPGYLARTAGNNDEVVSSPRAGVMTRESPLARAKSPINTRSTQRARFATEDQHSNNTLSSIPRSPRLRHVVPGSNEQASKSMTNLSPKSPNPPTYQTPARAPLFGEVLSVEQAMHSLGHGIPHVAVRRTSDSSLHPPIVTHLRNKSNGDVSPSSPTAWYLGVTPDLDDVNTNKGRRSSPGHNRNHSDFADTKVNTRNGVTESSLQSLISSSTSKTYDHDPVKHLSRLPVAAKRHSNHSDSSSPPSPRRPSSPYTAKTVSNGMASPPRQAVTHNSAVTPTRRSPRSKARSPEKLSINNASLKAYISIPPPKTSPPLRSSRPRQPVSSASTTVTREDDRDRSGSPQKVKSGMRITRKNGNDETKPRKIADSGPVDFAARRERIQRAYTKSIHESEQKEIRAANLRRLKERHLSDSIPNFDNDGHVGNHTSEISPLAEPPPDTGSGPVKPLQITTSTPSVTRSGASEDVKEVWNAADQDSPTLGMAGGFIHDEPPCSAISNETDIENEPQTEEARFSMTQPAKYVEPIVTPSRVLHANEHNPDSSRHGTEQAFDRQGDESRRFEIEATPLELAQRELTPTKDGFDQVLSMPGAFRDSEHYSTYGQLTFGTTITAASPQDTSPQRSRPATPIESCDDQSSGNDDFRSRLYGENGHHSNYSLSDIAPETPALDSSDVARLPLKMQRPSLPLPLDAMEDTPHDYLHAPFTDVYYGVSEINGTATAVHSNEKDKDDGPYDQSHEMQPFPRLYPASHHSAWTDNSADAADESSELEDYLRPHDVALFSDPEKKPTVTRKEVSAPLRPGSSARTDSYKTQPFQTFTTDTPRRPSSRHPQVPAPANNESFHLGPFERSPRHSVTSIPHWPDYSPPPIPHESGESSPAHSARTPPPPSLYNRRPPSSPYQSSHNGTSRNPESRRASEDYLYSPRASILTPRSSTQISLEDVSMSRSLEGTSTLPETEDDRKAAEKLKKRLFQRRMLIKELVDTESVYLKDMNVVEEIYKGTAEACPKLDSNDIKAIFRNSDEIVAFSVMFLDELKSAASSIYVPRSPRSRHGKDNSTTLGTPATTDDRFSVAATLTEETDAQKDRKTFIGSNFGKHLKKMQTVYTDFLKNGELASNRLTALQNDGAVKVWLSECNLVAKDLTAAWDLDALLVKPVQRITRYQLLLAQIFEHTSEDHPDYQSLQVTCRELASLLKNIDDLKKRIHMVGKIVGRKRKESDVRSGLAKAFGRRSEKLQASNVNRPHDDDAYLKVHEKFGDDYLRLQVVLRDVEFYTRQVSTYVNDFLRYLSSIELIMRMSASPYPEIESKWARFNMSMRDMGTVALEDHVIAVRKRVIEPFEQVIQAYGPPNLAMKKRTKRRLDYEKSLLAKTQGKKVDDKLKELVDQYEALNETLKLELPKLSALTEKVGNICLAQFVEIQTQWYGIWQDKVSVVLEESQMPKNIEDIVDMFNRDYKYSEARAKELGIVNGTLLDSSAGSQSSQSIKEDDSSSRSKGRPSNLSTRPRGISMSSDRSPIIPTPEVNNRLSGNFTFSPISTVAPGFPPLGNHSQSSFNAPPRAGSGSPAAADMAPAGSRPHASSTARPSTSRSYTSENGVPWKSTDYNGQSRRESSSTYNSMGHHVDGPIQSSRPYSGLFHSAMPLSDNPEDSQRSSRASSHDRNMSGGYNVLYLAASLFEFNISTTKSEAGYPYLTYQAGEIFDVIGEKGELWLAKNQDDPSDQVGWIWSKHFARLATD